MGTPLMFLLILSLHFKRTVSVTNRAPHAPPRFEYRFFAQILFVIAVQADQNAFHFRCFGGCHLTASMMDTSPPNKENDCEIIEVSCQGDSANQT
jgi:hypothetical protein